MLEKGIKSDEFIVVNHFLINLTATVQLDLNEVMVLELLHNDNKKVPAVAPNVLNKPVL